MCAINVGCAAGVPSILRLTGRSPDWLKFKNPAAPAVNARRMEDRGR